MSETAVREAIAEGRRELAEILAGLPAQSWDEPGLCPGWRVREVVQRVTA